MPVRILEARAPASGVRFVAQQVGRERFGCARRGMTAGLVPAEFHVIGNHFVEVRSDFLGRCSVQDHVGRLAEIGVVFVGGVVKPSRIVVSANSDRVPMVPSDLAQHVDVDDRMMVTHLVFFLTSVPNTSRLPDRLSVSTCLPRRIKSAGRIQS